MDVSDAGEDLNKMHTWEKWGVVTGSEWEMGQGRIRHSTPGQTCHSLRSQSKPFPLCRPLLAAGTPPFSSIPPRPVPSLDLPNWYHGSSPC